MIPSVTTEKGNNTDRDALVKAIETVRPLIDIPDAPCHAEAIDFTAAAETIIKWIEAHAEKKMPQAAE